MDCYHLELPRKAGAVHALRCPVAELGRVAHDLPMAPLHAMPHVLEHICEAATHAHTYGLRLR